jgi:hypothetical protein
MARFLIQQGWKKLEQVNAIEVGEVEDFTIFRDDGLVQAQPIMIHVWMLKAFLLYCQRKEREAQTRSKQMMSLEYQKSISKNTVDKRSIKRMMQQVLHPQC